ncbi:MAG: C40 family peptidase [Thiocapsa sp.]|nr:C40 family peptidase [Thiocapsa sp.]MCG6985548.1 C40 family peptidase [Thiocapsa sp.]
MRHWLRLVSLWAPLASGLLPGCATQRGDGLQGPRADVVLAGLSQVGTPYVYGGTNPGEGLDCSGLTYYAHHVAGVRIPRVSTEQLRAARPVAGRRPRAGDVVFFKTGPGQHHVGLMVDDERFVHASTSRREVRLDRLQTPYWQARYLGAGTYLD